MKRTRRAKRPQSCLAFGLRAPQARLWYGSGVLPRALRSRLGMLGAALAVTATMAWPSVNHAQSSTSQFPSRAITLVVNGGAGSLPDIFARPLAESLRSQWGQPVVVDNRPGAGGMAAMQQLKESDQSGHTLALITNAHMVWNPYVFPQLRYDPTTDLQPVSPIAILPMALVAGSSAGIASVAHLVDKARAQPGALNYASSGNGSPPHVLFEIWRAQAGLDIVHVPFKTGPEALTSTVAGDTQVYLAGTALVEPMVRDGRLTVLAVSPHVASESLREAPTLEQAGYPGFESAVWLGVVAPAGTPEAVVQSLNQAIGAALQSDLLANTMRANGSIALHESAADFGARIAQERGSWGPQIERLGIRPN